MNLYSVSYQLNLDDHDDARVSRYLKQLRARRVRTPVWMLNSPAKLLEVRDDLLRQLDDNDHLLVADVTHTPFAWHNLKNKSVMFRT
jgi:hypothetical protein